MLRLKIRDIEKHIDKDKFQIELFKYLNDPEVQRMPRSLVHPISIIVSTVILDRVVTNTKKCINISKFVEETTNYIINTFQTGDWPEDWEAQYIDGAVPWIISLTKNQVHLNGPKHGAFLKRRKNFAR